MVLFIAAALLLVTVALMVIRPLLTPPETVADGAAVDHPDGADAGSAEPAAGEVPVATAGGPPAVDATGREALEALIASRRERMERGATGAGP